jgi:hypothetical protein
MSTSGTVVSSPGLKHQAWSRAIIILSLLPLAGCIASAPGSGGGQQRPIQVAVSPTPQLIAVGAKQQFAAQLVNTSNLNVTWSLVLSPNSTSPATASELGSIDANGMYTAPTTVPACAAGVTCEIQVEIVATSQADTTASGQALANVHITIALSPSADTIGQGANLQFTPTLTGTPTGSSYQSVNWQAACSSCASGQGGGSFDPNNFGLYISAPFEQGVSTPQTITVSATSAFDPTQVATATVTEDQTDPPGQATTTGNGVIPCPTFGGGLGGATCYQVNTICDQVAPYSVYLKVNTPGSPIGTVIFTTGSGGSALYDYDSPEFFYTDSNGVVNNGGEAIVQGILNAGYTTVQVSFGSPFNNTNTENGWLQGPGGVRHLACRYATVAQWVYQNIHNSSTTEPFCATGNSGGSAAIGYALSEYGLGTIFNMVEPTSGPVMTRLDAGCSAPGNVNYNGTTACTTALTNMSYSLGANGTAAIVDAAYQSIGATTPTFCTDGITGTNGGNFLRFQSDSIDFSPSKSPALPIPDPPTTVNVVFGGADTSNSGAVPQGEWWWSSVAPKPTQACVQDAPHAIPASPSGKGVTQIVTDIQTLCKVH